MNPAAIIVLALMCAGLIYMFYDGWYNSTSHTDVEDPSKLRSDAKIKDIKTERVGRKQTSAIRTTVFFDDGFNYISHKAIRKQRLTSYTLEVNQETVAIIVTEAVAAHQDTVSKYSTPK